MATPAEMDRLEQRIEELEQQQVILRRQLAKSELDQWEGRIDDLEVQVHLASLELTDRIDPLVETLRNRWLDAKEQLSVSSSTATDVVDTLRSGLEQAMKDVRAALLEAGKVASG